LDCNEAFSLALERKEDNYGFWEPTYEFELIMDFTKKIPSLVSLIAYVMFNNSLGLGNYIYWTCE